MVKWAIYRVPGLYIGYLGYIGVPGPYLVVPGPYLVGDPGPTSLTVVPHPASWVTGTAGSTRVQLSK